MVLSICKHTPSIFQIHGFPFTPETEAREWHCYLCLKHAERGGYNGINWKLESSKESQDAFYSFLIVILLKDFNN